MLSDFEEKTGKKGLMISAVDLLKGIAVGAGMGIAQVEGANGGLHTNYEGKAQAAVDGLLKEGYDFAYIHVEAPDECGHHGDLEGKIRAIEMIDEQIVGPLLEGLKEAGEDYSILVMPDHPTPIAVKTHVSDPVPYLLYRSTGEVVSGIQAYTEETAAGTGIYGDHGYELMKQLLGR